MAIILGIDAAWKEGNASGVALLSTEQDNRRVLAAHSSYAAFVAHALGAELPLNTSPNEHALLRASESLAGAPVDVVSIDMPLSRRDISGRRCADDEISRNFGAAWAGTHSPSAARPGALSTQIRSRFEAAGFALVTEAQGNRPRRSLIECYPLAALVNLLRAERRPPYKIGKRYTYEGQSGDRIADILAEWRKIRSALGTQISELPFLIPDRGEVRSEKSLKPAEDTLDAIICAWVGARFFEGGAESYGDADAAIWVPRR